MFEDLQRSASTPLTVLDKGGAGDCLFHSIAAGLEYMLRENSLSRGHVQTYFDTTDFTYTPQSKHMVLKLRRMVATYTTSPTRGPEHILRFLMTCEVQQRAQVDWFDAWDPQALLRESGFECLLSVSVVVAAGHSEEPRGSKKGAQKHEQS